MQERLGVSVDGHESGRSFDAVRAAVAEPLLGRGDVVQVVFAHVQEEVPGPFAARDRAYRDGLLAAVAALMAYCLEALRHGPGFEKPIPAEAVEQARRAARAGIGSTVVVRRYIAGHRRLGEFVAEQACRAGLADDDSAMLHLRTTQEALLEEFVAAILDEYDRECRRIADVAIQKSRQQRSAAIVHELLRGAALGNSELIELGYELEAWHVGLIAVCAEAKSVVRRLASTLGCEFLSIVCGERTVWAWLGAQRRLAFAEVERAFFVLQESTDCLLVVGEPGIGCDGLRLTHRQARMGLDVARRRGLVGLVRYRDVALEAAALRDEGLGDVLIARYLAPLDDRHGGGCRRRGVLRAFFDADHNKSSAAHALGVDPRTVHRQVVEIEERLGCRIHECHAEIAVALRVEELRQLRDEDAPLSAELRRRATSVTLG